VKVKKNDFTTEGTEDTEESQREIHVPAVLCATLCPPW
jgi:hypothetical protein